MRKGIFAFFPPVIRFNIKTKKKETLSHIKIIIKL